MADPVAPVDRRAAITLNVIVIRRVIMVPMERTPLLGLMEPPEAKVGTAVRVTAAPSKVREHFLSVDARGPSLTRAIPRRAEKEEMEPMEAAVRPAARAALAAVEEKQVIPI